MPFNSLNYYAHTLAKNIPKGYSSSMARTCWINGTKPLVGNHVSHAHNKSKRRQYPNLQKRRLYVPEIKRHITVRISTRALRSIDRRGLMPYLKKRGLTLEHLMQGQGLASRALG